MRLIAKFESGALDQLVTRLKGFESQADFAGMLNAVGEGLRAATVAAETAQTGLQGDVLERAQMPAPASPGRLVYRIRTHGGNIRLKYFDAKEGGGGVTAHPWNAQHFYPGGFITSGRAGDRKESGRLGGQVYVATGPRSSKANERPHKGKSRGLWWRKITQERSGLFIPTEMTRGETAAAFEMSANAALAEIQTRIVGLLGA